MPAPMRAPQILLLALVIVLHLSFEFIGDRMRQPEPKTSRCACSCPLPLNRFCDVERKRALIAETIGLSAQGVSRQNAGAMLARVRRQPICMIAKCAPDASSQLLGGHRAPAPPRSGLGGIGVGFDLNIIISTPYGAPFGPLQK